MWLYSGPLIGSCKDLCIICFVCLFFGIHSEVTHSHGFSRAVRQLRVITSRSDWFTGLSELFCDWSSDDITEKALLGYLISSQFIPNLVIF